MPDNKPQTLTEVGTEQTRAVENMLNRLTKYNKKIRFALVLKDDKEIHTLEELTDDANFDIEDLVERCIERNNRLTEWLDDHNHKAESAAVTQLINLYNERAKNAVDYNDALKNLRWLAESLYKVFGKKITAEAQRTINGLSLERIDSTSKKAAELKEELEQDDEYLLKHIQQIARNQGELDQILNRRNDKKTVYLKSIESDADNDGDRADYYIVAEKNIAEGFNFVGFETKDDKVNVQIRSGEQILPTRKVEQLLKKYRNAFSNVTVYAMPSTAEEWERANEPGNNGLFPIPRPKKSSYLKRQKNGLEIVKNDLLHYIDAGFPLIYLNTFEEDKADKLIDEIRAKRNDKQVFTWTVLGFSTRDKDGHYTRHWKPGWTLKHTLDRLIDDYILHLVVSTQKPPEQAAVDYDLGNTILLLKDAHNLLKDDEIIAKLKFLAQLIYTGKIDACNIVIVSPILTVPPELEHYMTIVKLGALTDTEIEDILDKFCKAQGVKNPRGDFRERLVRDLRGMSEFEILNVLALAILDDRELKNSDTELIIDQKRQLIEKAALLELIEVDENENDIGGLEYLKEWLKRKHEIFRDIRRAEKFGVDIPKGVMIAGMPGCGKSLCAKVTAAIFDIPLIKMDMGRIMGKYVGESEKNMRRALELSEKISPCVLWIDEMEKAFAGTGNDGGSDVTMRLMGLFLTWLQEKENPVFVVATANDATRLPPELLRRGRFDEIFYVGLPNIIEREKIFDIHFNKRSNEIHDYYEDWQTVKKDKRAFSLFMRKTRNYSGADIEGVVREAVEKTAVDTKFVEGKQKIDLRLLNDVISSMSSSTKPNQVRKLLQNYENKNFRQASKPLPDSKLKKQVYRRMSFLKKWKRTTMRRVTEWGAYIRSLKIFAGKIGRDAEKRERKENAVRAAKIAETRQDLRNMFFERELTHNDDV